MRTGATSAAPNLAPREFGLLATLVKKLSPAVVNILTTRVIERSQVVPGSFGVVDQRILPKVFRTPVSFPGIFAA